MTKWIAGAACLVLAVPVLFLGALTGGFSEPLATSAGTATASIPPDYAALYAEAAAKFRIPRGVLAAIGKVECDHGRNPACRQPNSAGAEGPMQFLPPTFKAYASASGGPTPSPYSARDAVFAAAAKLSADGVNKDPWAAIFSYNRDDQYVSTVVSWSIAYGWIPGATVLTRAVLSHPRLSLQVSAAGDVSSDQVDPRVLAVLLMIVTTHRLDEVGPLIRGHDFYVDGTNRVSNHALGRAVDISRMDGLVVTASNKAAEQVVETVIALTPPLRPEEIGAPWHFDQLGWRSFTEGHGNHIHIGFGPA